MSSNLNMSQGNTKMKYGYKHYALGDEYHIVKTKKNNSCDCKGNFEIVPNHMGIQTEQHIQTREFEKSPQRGLERSSNFRSSLNRKKINRILKMKISKNSNHKDCKHNLLLTFLLSDF